ncbi:MAG: M28 family peptidase [Nitrospiraceae bacterium]
MSLIDRLRAHLLALIGARHPLSSPEALRAAEHYLAGQFQQLGLEVSSHPFEALGSTYRNVIASLPASPRTDTEEDTPPLIIAAHYDTVPGSPGADDNASGLAVMLAVATSLRGVPQRRGLRFIGFCLEEEDRLGSLAYASSLKAAGQEILGVIVLECVGYARSEEGSQFAPPNVPIAVPSTGDFLGIIGNTASAELAGAVEGAINRHVPDLRTVSLLVPGQGERLPDTRRSDHAPFWDHGYPAVMLTDTANFRNPHYHQPTDTLATLNLTFMRQVAVAVAAAARDLAGGD